MRKPYKTVAEHSLGSTPKRSLSCLTGCAFFALTPIVLVASCTLIRGRIPRWVHPQIEGTVVDAQTGHPIKNAKVEFVRSEFLGGTTSTDENGDFVLAPVVEMTWFTLPGDPYYRSFVVASANGYDSVEHETGHGTGDVWGGGPPPRRLIDFWLDGGAGGRSVETMPWDARSQTSDEPAHVREREAAAGPVSNGESSPPGP